MVEGEEREKRKKKLEHNAQVHAAVSVAGLTVAVVAFASATAAASSTRIDKQMANTDTAMATQCVETAEGADREHLISAIVSAVNVHSHGDILNS